MTAIEQFLALVTTLVDDRGAVYNGEGEHDSIALAERLYQTLTDTKLDGYLFMRCLKFSRSHFAEERGEFHPDSLLDDAGYSLLRSRRINDPLEDGDRSPLEKCCERRAGGRA